MSHGTHVRTIDGMTKRVERTRHSKRHSSDMEVGRSHFGNPPDGPGTMEGRSSFGL